MPNHFHLLIKQNADEHAIEKLLHSLLLRYTGYFNKKYGRVGSLFQGRYKAKIIYREEYLIHLSRYIHLNPKDHFPNLIDAYSSYQDYIGLRRTSWLKPDVVLSYFKTADSYKDFVEGPQPIIQELNLEDYVLES